MRTSLLGKLALAALVSGGALFATSHAALAVPSAAGTIISNTATATYSDGTNTYNTTSNTVTATVQNAPAVLVTDTSSFNPQISAPNQSVTDTFTIQNTGNATAIIDLTNGNTISSFITGNSNDTAAAATSYTVTIPVTSSCGGSIANPYASLSALQTFLNTCNIKQTDTITVAFAYATNTPAATITDAAPATVTVGVTGVETQALVGISGNPGYAAAQTSSAAATGATASQIDKVEPDARLDIAKSVNAFTGTNPMLFTLTVNNGGYFDTTQQNLAPFLGGTLPTTAAVMVTDPLPIFNSSPLALTAAPSATTTANGPAVANIAFYYTTDATGATGWTVVPGTVTVAGSTATAGSIPPNTTKIIGVFITGTGAFKGYKTTATTSSQGTVPTPELTISLSIAQPTGTGAGTAGSVKNVADSIVFNNATTPQMVGPSNTNDNTTPSAAGIQAMVSNTLPAQGAGTGTGTGAGTGASNQISTQAVSAYTVLNGPAGNASATGNDMGNFGSTNSDNDFTVAGFAYGVNAVNQTGATAATPNGAALATGSTPFYLHHSILNSGNSNDTYNFSNSALPASITAVSYTTWNGSACTTTALTIPFAVATGATQEYCVKYTPNASVQAFIASDITITATSVGDVTKTNATHDVLYAGGALAIFKSLAVTTCPGSPFTGAVNGVVTGCTITYTLTVKNNSAAGAGAGNITFNASSLVITEDGTAAPNTWGTNDANGNPTTGGVTAVPSSSGLGTVTFTQVGSATATAAGDKGFKAAIGTAPAPGASGTITFSVIVK